MDAVVHNKVMVFDRGTGGWYSNARIGFYSIGSNIDLSVLDGLVSTYMASLT